MYIDNIRILFPESKNKVACNDPKSNFAYLVFKLSHNVQYSFDYKEL